MNLENVLHKLLYDVKIETPARSILESICQQTQKDIALTDRQYALVVEKLKPFESELDDVLIEHIPTRMPLRSIDRQKYIKIVDHQETAARREIFKQDCKWIKVRFPFAKKDIVKIQSLNISSKEYYHVRGSHEHFYKLTPTNAFKVVEALKLRNFEIDNVLIEYVSKVKDILTTELKYNSSFENVTKRMDVAEQEYIHSLTPLQQVDRSIRYGYSINKGDAFNLTEMIAYRTDAAVPADPAMWSINDIASSINTLDRFPLIVTVDEDDCYRQLTEIHQAFLPYVNDELQSVMFRVDSNDIQNHQLNAYVKNQKLNNWVDNRTKIVYIKKNKLPKPLLSSSFLPICCLSKSSIRSHNNVKSYVEINCDCIIYNDNHVGLFRSYASGKL
jgi:hypothetical protein